MTYSAPLHPIAIDVDTLDASPLPVDLTLIKAHCSVDFADQDALLEAYLLAGIKAFEDTTHRTLLRRAHRWTLWDFPRTVFGQIRLPRGKTRAVTRIEYSLNGSTDTLTGPSSTPAGTEYLEDLRGDDGGIVMPPRGGCWPTPDCDVPAPVVITFEAGWSADELPQDALNALLFYVRMSLDGLRGAEDPTRNAASLETWEALVSGYRLSRFY
jgi:uncharacterized phiE125 gp8 family phage protein